jgi:anti-sigma factor RsiW
MKEKARELLYRSFDDELTPEEQKELQAALAGDTQLQREKERLADLRDALSKGAARSFRPFFAERVMHAITTAEKAKNGVELFFESLQFAFRRVALVGATAILLLLAYHFVKSGDVSVAAVLGMSQETLEDVLESPFDATLEDLL